jgi:hypothetical protein
MARKLVLLLFVVLLALPGTALAVWGGEPDGNGHPSVGAMYIGTPEGPFLICSGSYAGPSHDGHDLFLTAGHCLPPAELGIPPFAFSVSFDNDASDGIDSPITVVSYHQMPGFGHDRGDRRDLGILLLPTGSVATHFPGTPAVQLPSAGYLDQLKRDGELNFRIAEIVGYGVTPVWEPAGPTFFEFDGVRKVGTSKITGLTRSALIFNQNRHGIGTGSGLCFGDSGSPQFDEGTLLVLSVTSGGNGQCNSSNTNYRVDTPQAREFLGQFMALP